MCVRERERESGSGENVMVVVVRETQRDRERRKLDGRGCVCVCMRDRAEKRGSHLSAYVCGEAGRAGGLDSHCAWREEGKGGRGRGREE